VATISEENIITLLQGYKIRVQEMFEQRLKNQIHLLSLIQLRSPESIVSAQKQRLEEIRKRLLKSVQSRLENTRNHLDQTTSHLDSLGPQKVLERGFALVWQGSVPVTNAEQVQINERLSIDLANGRIDVQVVGATQKETQLSLPFAT
jgi:exodeoxyribonuclease VII large subunit